MIRRIFDTHVRAAAILRSCDHVFLSKVFVRRRVVMFALYLRDSCVKTSYRKDLFKGSAKTPTHVLNGDVILMCDVLVTSCHSDV